MYFLTSTRFVHTVYPFRKQWMWNGHHFCRSAHTSASLTGLWSVKVNKKPRWHAAWHWHYTGVLDMNFSFSKQTKRVEAVQKLSPCISFLPKNPASLSAAPQSEAAKKKEHITGLKGKNKKTRQIHQVSHLKWNRSHAVLTQHEGDESDHRAATLPHSDDQQRSRRDGSCQLSYRWRCIQSLLVCKCLLPECCNRWAWQETRHVAAQTLKPTWY